MVEAEKGEAMGILSRKATRKSGKPFMDLTNALNKGEDFDSVLQHFADSGMDYNVAETLAGKEMEVLILRSEADRAVENSLLIENNALLREANRQRAKKTKKTETHFVGSKKVIKFGNTTRIVK